jgi:hypothetical protein
MYRPAQIAKAANIPENVHRKASWSWSQSNQPPKIALAGRSKHDVHLVDPAGISHASDGLDPIDRRAGFDALNPSDAVLGALTA